MGGRQAWRSSQKKDYNLFIRSAQNDRRSQDVRGQSRKWRPDVSRGGHRELSDSPQNVQRSTFNRLKREEAQAATRIFLRKLSTGSKCKRFGWLNVER